MSPGFDPKLKADSANSSPIFLPADATAGELLMLAQAAWEAQGCRVGAVLVQIWWSQGVERELFGQVSNNISEVETLGGILCAEH